VELPLLYQGIPTRARQRRASELLERFGLERRASHRPAQLSGGQQQRVAFARAIVARPRLVLADEPTGNLDTSHGEQVLRDLEALAGEGAAIVMVTHSPEHAARAGRTVRLRDGMIVSHA
jgi:putative ABC transport system ATP-binding protein